MVVPLHSTPLLTQLSSSSSQLTGSGIEIQDELQILEGVCKLMSKMSYADAGLTLQRVMTPVGGQLEVRVCEERGLARTGYLYVRQSTRYISNSSLRSSARFARRRWPSAPAQA